MYVIKLHLNIEKKTMNNFFKYKTEKRLNLSVDSCPINKDVKILPKRFEKQLKIQLTHMETYQNI